MNFRRPMTPAMTGPVSRPIRSAQVDPERRHTLVNVSRISSAISAIAAA